MKQENGFWKTIVTIVSVVASTSLLTSCDENEALPTKSIDASFEEIDGMVIAEIETLPATDGWSEERSADGFSGYSYYQNTGDNSMNRQGEGILEYNIKINNPGTYRFIWHCKVNEGDNTTESNDSWLRLPDADDFFGKKNNTIKYPKGGKMIQSTTVTKGSSGEGWMKVFSSGTLDWNWSTKTSDHEGLNIYASFNKAGSYTVQISRRSKGHALDRFVLYDEDTYTSKEAQDLTLPETRR